MYWKSISGTHANQCIRPWICGLLQTSRPMESRRRLKKSSISGGQQSSVVSLKPGASSDATAPVLVGATVVVGAMVVVGGSVLSSMDGPRPTSWASVPGALIPMDGTWRFFSFGCTREARSAACCRTAAKCISCKAMGTHSRASAKWSKCCKAREGEQSFESCEGAVSDSVASVETTSDTGLAAIWSIALARTASVAGMSSHVSWLRHVGSTLVDAASTAKTSTATVFKGRYAITWN